MLHSCFIEYSAVCHPIHLVYSTNIFAGEEEGMSAWTMAKALTLPQVKLWLSSIIRGVRTLKEIYDCIIVTQCLIGLFLLKYLLVLLEKRNRFGHYSSALFFSKMSSICVCTALDTYNHNKNVLNINANLSVSEQGKWWHNNHTKWCTLL